MTNMIKKVITTETINVMIKVVIVIATTAPVDTELESVISTVELIVQYIVQ